MKKILRYAFLVAAAMLSTAAMAEADVFGAIDKGWGDAGCNRQYTLTANKTITFDFVVKNSRGTSDADGWVTHVVGTKDYYFMQPIGFAVTEFIWDNADKNIDAGNGSWYIYNNKNYDYNTFRTDIVEANVKVEIKRVGTTLYQTTDITTKDSKKLRQYFVMETGNEDLAVTLGSDYAVLALNSADITESTTPTEPTGTLIGKSDNTTTWWTAFSDYYTIADKKQLTLDFYNYSNQVQNFLNWIVGVTSNANRNDDSNGYKEYFILRSDNYAWGIYGNTNPTDAYYSDRYILTSNFNWDTFKDDLHGAKVHLVVAHEGKVLTATATITPEGKTESYEEKLSIEVSDTDLADNADVRAWLSVEGGHLILTNYEISDVLPNAINAVKEVAPAAKAVRYNVAGQQVDGAFKGLIIENGKKIVVK